MPAASCTCSSGVLINIIQWVIILARQSRLQLRMNALHIKVYKCSRAGNNILPQDLMEMPY